MGILAGAIAGTMLTQWKHKKGATIIIKSVSLTMGKLASHFELFLFELREIILVGCSIYCSEYSRFLEH